MSDRQIKKLLDSGNTWGWFKKNYQQPTWCGYPEAIDPLGCWSLIIFNDRGRIRRKTQCVNCDCFIANPTISKMETTERSE